MNIAMEQTEEYVHGQLKAKYGDCFIRGNNGKHAHGGGVVDGVLMGGAVHTQQTDVSPGEKASPTRRGPRRRHVFFGVHPFFYASHALQLTPPSPFFSIQQPVLYISTQKRR